ncbi:hypothetical protein EDC01DRAFT_730687 [Geopyxis carbonaria]|nr:hypothetical protein EDC01DRAFT_730687 [Geopyxis carbonaria]
MALFPDTIAITFSAPFLVVRCRKLPPMPWPISIAGVPLWFTKDLAALPIEFGMPGLGREVSFTSAVLSHLKVHTAEFESLMIILRYRFNVEILSILWTGNRYLITVPGVTEIRRLPENMMGLLITYKYADDEDRISAVVAHRKLANVVRDDTDYTPHLRPGVMMSCETDDGQELLMTSGIPVRDPQDGQVYITTTTHNKTFPPGEQKVWHSTGSHSEIGKVQRALGHTGISLIRLHAGISYGQGTFGNIPLRYMREPDIPVGDHVFFNSPFSGYCDGIVSAVEFRRTPGPYWSTVTVLWIYVGQEPMEDLCGSAVWDKQGNVVALFRCADKNIKNGFALATSVLPLIKAGMQICKAEQWIW